MLSEVNRFYDFGTVSVYSWAIHNPYMIDMLKNKSLVPRNIIECYKVVKFVHSSFNIYDFVFE